MENQTEKEEMTLNTEENEQHSETENVVQSGEEFVSPERLKLRHEGEAKRRAIEAEFRKINAIDPSVKSFDDLMLMENADEFADRVRRGYSLTDAFIITNQKKLSQRIKTAAVRSALARMGAKKHLTGAGTGGGEAAIDVPAETYSLYKSLYPGITDGEIKKHYKQHNK
ncbi:MAG: hypothetical protein E7614_07700 [Ruminococcaceae bacterium]|nr:hypothetical protein [Oscillospiraceae bacterium]